MDDYDSFILRLEIFTLNDTDDNTDMVYDILVLCPMVLVSVEKRIDKNRGAYQLFTLYTCDDVEPDDIECAIADLDGKLPCDNQIKRADMIFTPKFKGQGADLFKIVNIVPNG